MLPQLVGEIIGNYQIETRLSDHERLAVWRGEHYVTRQPAVIYLAPTFLANMEQVARLDHPYILAPLECGSHQEWAYVAMPLIEGQTLGDKLRDQSLNQGEVLTILKRIAASLDYAHDQGVLHRCLTAHSILFDAFDNLYVTNFGIPQPTSPHYTAPEAWDQHPLNRHTDVYALGILLYQVVTGRLPFESDDLDTLRYQHLNSTPPIPILTDDPSASLVNQIIFRALAKFPEDRYRTAGELIHAYEQAIADRLPPLLAVRLPDATEGGDMAIAPRLLWTSVNVDGRSYQQPTAEEEVDNRIRDCVWLPSKDGFLSAGLDGRVYRWSLESNTPDLLAEADSPILCLSISGDGGRFATGHLDGSLRVWDIDGSLLHDLQGHQYAVLCCALSGNGAILASGGEDRTLWIWDLWQGQPIQVIRKHHDAVTACALNDDGHLAVSASADKTLRLWNSYTGESLQIFSGHLAAVTACDLKGEMLLSGAADGELRAWDILMEEPPLILSQHTNAITDCRIQRLEDGVLGISTSWDGSVRVWDLFAGNEVRAFETHSDAVLCGDFLDELILFGTRSGKLYVHTRTPRPTLPFHQDRVISLVIEDQTTFSLSQDQSLHELSTETGESLRTFPLNAHPSCGTTSSQYILVGYQNGLLHCLDRASGRVRWEASAHFTPIQFVVALEKQRIVTGNQDGILSLWNTVNGVRLGTASVQTARLRCGTVWDGMVVVGTQEGELSAWNMKSGSRQRIYGSLGQPIMVCATRADLLIAGLADGQIVAWRKGDEEPLLNFQGHSAALSALAIHPDQHLLFTASLDGEYSLWDIVQGIRLTSRRLKSVVTSAVWGDNYILVFGNSTGHLWAMTMN